MLTTRTPEAHQYALDKFKTFRSDGQFVPFSVDKQTIVFPGFDGGAEWGGSAVDTATGVIYVNENEMAWTGGLTANTARTPGEMIYNNLCDECHGAHRDGSPPAYPSLIGIDDQLSDEEIADIVHQGKERMPSFPNMDDAMMRQLLQYLHTDEPTDGQAAPAAKELPSSAGGDSLKYRFTGYRKFLDQDGYPAISPPWGTLNAIDLNTGKYLWKIPLGEYPALAAKGVKNTGSENYGGPIVTAGRLVFIGATVFDRKMRAFDSHTGKLLWETTLPYAGVATPATYMVDGRQYVVIATGGGRDPNSPSGGEYVAFALP
jgi:quinoprotein glucose dehydrogenase